MNVKTLCLALLMIVCAVAANAQQRRLKIYISADMEGVVGVVSNEQLGPQGFEYARFREFMTQEVNAAIQGAIAGGATEIVISDSHGNGRRDLHRLSHWDHKPRGRAGAHAFQRQACRR
jgi:D-amino peptidase